MDIDGEPVHTTRLRRPGLQGSCRSGRGGVRFNGPDTTLAPNGRASDDESQEIMTNPPLQPPTGNAADTGARKPKKKNWFLRHKIVSGVGAIALIGGITAVANSGGGGAGTPDLAQSSPSVTVSETPAAEPAVTQTPTPETAVAETSAAQPAATQTPAPDTPQLTASQANALRSAKNYLTISGFSRQGLIDQLSSEYGNKYSVADATLAVESLNADWNEQARRKAASYLEMMGYSRQGLIDQLSSEYGDKFTVEQATFGVDAQNADWNEQARRKAKSYLEITGYSRQGLIDQLSSEYGDKFTVEQATAGVDAAGL